MVPALTQGAVSAIFYNAGTGSDGGYVVQVSDPPQTSAKRSDSKIRQDLLRKGNQTAYSTIAKPLACKCERMRRCAVATGARHQKNRWDATGGTGNAFNITQSFHLRLLHLNVPPIVFFTQCIAKEPLLSASRTNLPHHTAHIRGPGRSKGPGGQQLEMAHIREDPAPAKHRQQGTDAHWMAPRAHQGRPCSLWLIHLSGKDDDHDDHQSSASRQTCSLTRPTGLVPRRQQRSTHRPCPSH